MVPDTLQRGFFNSVWINRCKQKINEEDKGRGKIKKKEMSRVAYWI